MEKTIFRALKIISSLMTVVFILSYGGDPVALIGSFGTAVATLMLQFIPEELF